METNQFHPAGQIAANSSPHQLTSPLFPMATLAWLAACLLIFLGAAFELGMLGFGPYNSTGVWFLDVVGRNAWIMLSDLIVPQVREIVKVWPLVLVSLGSAILLLARNWNRFDSRSATSSGREENHAN